MGSKTLFFEFLGSKNWGLELLAKVCFKGTEKVLDVGCGDGKLSAEIAVNLHECSVLGINLSEVLTLSLTLSFPMLPSTGLKLRKLH